jgi:hypothetical protein
LTSFDDLPLYTHSLEVQSYESTCLAQSTS